jgi:hypothetical protein
MKRILIGQLGSYGDCLIATTIAHQIKMDNPRGCHLTWGIGSHYSRIIENNPDVDAVWEYPITSRWEVVSKWYQFAKEAQERKDRGEFDEIYLTQVYPGFPERFYGSLRESMFRAYGKVASPPIMELELSLEEVINVQDFARLHTLSRRTDVILFECSPESGQSFVTQNFALRVARMIVTDIPGSCVILSGSEKINTNHPDIIDASGLTFRENAELTEYCTLFVGTGSGLTQIIQTDWAKSLPIIQLLKPRTVASINWDRKQQGLPEGNVIEMTNCTELQVYHCCISAMVDFGFARRHFNEEIVPDFNIIRFHMRFDKAKREGDYLGILVALLVTIEDYGLSMGLWHFLMTFPESIWKLISRKAKGIT